MSNVTVKKCVELELVCACGAGDLWVEDDRAKAMAIASAAGWTVEAHRKTPTVVLCPKCADKVRLAKNNLAAARTAMAKAQAEIGLAKRPADAKPEPVTP